MDIHNVPFEFKHMLFERGMQHLWKMKDMNEAQTERYIEKIFRAEIVIAAYFDETPLHRIELLCLKGEEIFLHEIQDVEELQKPYPAGRFETLLFKNRAHVVNLGRPKTH